MGVLKKRLPVVLYRGLYRQTLPAPPYGAPPKPPPLTFRASPYNLPKYGSTES